MLKVLVDTHGSFDEFVIVHRPHLLTELHRPHSLTELFRRQEASMSGPPLSFRVANWGGVNKLLVVSNGHRPGFLAREAV